MISIAGPYNSGVCAGGAGVSTANANTPRLTGKILAVYVKYNDSPPAGTTDVTLATVGTNMPAVTFLTLANAATDGWFYPRVQVHSVAGALLTLDGTRTMVHELAISDLINVKIEQANDADSIDVTFVLEI